ncbi:MAG: OmpA family protein [Bacteroidales bacterium]|jgi:NitT/TauT family transport system substrate-binding protein|nr:OmpA family protein [Bacteroidales bacterium]MBR4327647.1 OmpA family protein [Bacteroidales bacterium]
MALTKFAKALIGVVGVGAVAGGLYYAGQKGLGGGSDADAITIGTNTYAGFLPFMYLNNGADPNEDCILYKEYGLKAKIIVQDDFAAGRSAFKSGDIDIIYCTADALGVEMSRGSDMNDAKFINISNWSRGADAIVVNSKIKTVADLKGKVIACSEGTASNTLLINTLETNNMAYSDINTSSTINPNKVNLKIVASGLDAAQIFKAGQCDAAVVFSPDDQDIVSTMPGSKVLISTKQASSIICDGLVAKQSYIEKNKEKVTKLISALLYANTQMNNNPAAVKQAAKAFAKAYQVDEEFVIDGSKNIYYVTLEDEANFFGLTTCTSCVKGEDLYNKMAGTYEGLGLCKNPLPWQKVAESSIIESLFDNPSQVKGDQSAEQVQQFTEVQAEEVKEEEKISNKTVSVEYDVNSDLLNQAARDVITREFVPIAKEFSGARIMIEGNTDNTGSAALNKDLSYRRALSIKNFLVKEYKFDPNRFIVVGNGSQKAIAAGSTGSDAKYRMTEFKLVAK